MVSRDEGKVVLWPVYFDAAARRPLRRVRKSLAVPEPKADEIAKAAQALRMRPVLERDAAHPATWWRRDGRVLVDARGSKSVLVLQIGEKLRELRAASA